ncbi:MAG: sodium:alanine symporter family protein [Clostridia bacterium]|nr:sodium:alanine symporter family protein [Clostridia bacterium]
MELLSLLNTYVIAPALPVCLMAAGLWYSAALAPCGLFRPSLIFRVLFRRSSTDGISPAAAMTVALAGTLGVGNIVGVAGAIILGGPGALFWMWVSALLAMVLKYAEITLALLRRRRAADGSWLGGAMYYAADAFGRFGRWLGSIFALLCLANALTMGSVIQINAAATALDETAALPPVLVGGGMVVLVMLTVRRGARGIARLTERLIPAVSIAFLLVSVAAIWMRREVLPDAWRAVFRGAWSADGAIGGIGGFLFSRSLRYGTMRGLLSNEAGCGTAPIAHAESSTTRPAEQGLWGIVEVFVDTILLCTVTGFVILTAGGSAGDLDGMRLTLFAYRAALGDWAGYFVAAAIFLFAYATIVCWAHYGLRCLRWFGEGRGRRVIFLVLYGISIWIGAVTAPDAVWEIADFAIGVMALLNLVVLCVWMPDVKRETSTLSAAVRK